MLAQTGFVGVDATDPTAPAGHAYGIRVSSRLTSDYRRRWRKQAMDVTPEEVIECLNDAKIKNWVLMGLHGYVGYLPMPRATQDVDVLVPYSQKQRAANAIANRWPTLSKQSLSQVIRFSDPQDCDSDGKPQPVIDLMLPWSPFQELILREHVIEDAETHSRYPTLEAAIVLKYAPLLSPQRSLDEKDYDACDLRRIIKANANKIDHARLRTLGDLVWEQGAADVLRFIVLSLADQPFPT
ncbi:hypothetical protein SH139x_001566 [Planctomycetaceae bacterium SH139]